MRRSERLITTNDADHSALSVRATGLTNGKPRFSDPQGTKTPEPIDIKLDVGDYVGDISPQAKFDIPATTGGGATYA